MVSAVPYAKVVERVDQGCTCLVESCKVDFLARRNYANDWAKVLDVRIVRVNDAFSSFETAYESMDEVHFPAGIRGIALIGSTVALSFLRLVVFFKSISSCERHEHEI